MNTVGQKIEQGVLEAPESSNSPQLVSKHISIENWPFLLTEKELVQLLRVPEVSKSTDYHNVIDQLKRFHDLPCIHICRQPLYPLADVLEWLREKVQKERR